MTLARLPISRSSVLDGKFTHAPIGMVRLGVIRGFEALVGEFGGTPKTVLERAGLVAASAESSDSLITLDAYSNFLRVAGQEAHRPSFSAEFGLAFDTRNLGSIGYLFDFAPDIGTALRDFSANFELVQDNTEINLQLNGDLARVSYGVRGGKAADKAEDAEFSIAMLSAVFAAGHEDRVPINRVDLEHRPEWAPEALGNRLGKDFRGNQASNAIYMKRDVVERIPSKTNPFLYGLILDRVRAEMKERRERRSIVQSVQDALCTHFQTGRPEKTTAPQIAADLGLTERTLHRKLTLQGTNFRILRNGALLDEGGSLLATNHLSVTDIAYRLGFSETSAFSRAFKALSGHPPVKLRTGGS